MCGVMFNSLISFKNRAYKQEVNYSGNLVHGHSYSEYDDLFLNARVSWMLLKRCKVSKARFSKFTFQCWFWQMAQSHFRKKKSSSALGKSLNICNTHDYTLLFPP